MTAEPIRIATRASRLALWQAEYTASRLREIDPGCEVELVQVSTEGDRDQTEPLHLLGSLGVFTREVQRTVLDNHADLAVHSLKDLPTEDVAGLTLAAVPERASMFDVLVLPQSGNAVPKSESSPLDILPKGCTVATGSIRRRALLLHQRPDLKLCEVRGNIETRLRKLDEGQFDAIILAEAALDRLELAHRITARLTPPIFYPAVSQGALGIECRKDDEATRQRLAALTDPKTHASVLAERTLLAELRAGCHAPLGVFSSWNEDEFTMEAVVLSPDGREKISVTVTGTLADVADLGKQAAQELAAMGAERLINEAKHDESS